MEIISSSKNEKIKNISALLKSKKARTEQGVFVVEGTRIARDVLKSARDNLVAIFISESFLSEGLWKEYPEFEAAGFPDRLPVTVVKGSVFAAVSETVTPQGILCIVQQPSYTYDDIVTRNRGTDEAESAADGKRTSLKLLILEDIQDPGNLGTMVRTAEAAGMNGIIMSRGTVDIFSPKVTRSTMGGIFRVPFMYVDDLPATLDRLKNDDVKVYAAYLRDGEDYDAVEYYERAAVMIGNEGNGLTEAAVAHASQNVFIPMQGEVESLNAGVAAALLMYKINNTKGTAQIALRRKWNDKFDFAVEQ